MLVSTYHLSDTERANARRQWIEARPILIGRASTCHVVIDDVEVAEEHLRLWVRDGAIVVENLASTADVDGVPLHALTQMTVAESRPIRIGGTIVKVRMQRSAVVTTTPARGSNPSLRDSEPPARPPTARPDARPTTPITPRESRPTTPVSPYGTLPTFNPPVPRPPTPPPNLPMTAVNPPAVRARPPMTRPRPRKDLLSDDDTEQSFLTALRANPQDDGTRMVYADWLEQRGHTAKAELVRLREYLDTLVHKNASDIDWRAVCVRTPIEHCAQNRCPSHWDALAPHGDGDFVRSCGTCKKTVTFCGDLNEVRAAAFDERPVVFDVSLDRVAAHSAYRHFADELAPSTDHDDDIEDDPDGYTLDVPPSNFRR